MRVVLFGATGQIGSRVLTQALPRGHQMTVVVREPSKITVADPGLTVVEGNARDRDAVVAVIAGHEAVISALGPGGPGVSDQHLDILTVGTSNLIAGMRTAGIRRSVVLGSVATLNATPDTLLRDMAGFPEMARNISGAHLEALDMWRASGLDWTVVCPPPTVEPGDPTGHYRTRADYLLEGDPRRARITTGDIASFVLDELEGNEFVGHRVNVSA